MWKEDGEEETIFYFEGLKVVCHERDWRVKGVSVSRSRINEFMYVFVRFVSNLAVNGCLMLEIRVFQVNEGLGKLVTLSRQKKTHS